jgi:hypothetical protein
MLHPSIESTNPSAAVAGSSAALLQSQHDTSKELALAAASQVREEERPSPICAARWAY